jgi:hypothetical protein
MSAEDVSPSASFYTLYDLPSLQDGATIGIERGSELASFVDQRLNSLELRAYGTGPPPFINLRDPLDDSAWDSLDGYANTYQQTVSTPSTISGAYTPRLWEEYTELPSKGSVSDVDAAPGSFHVEEDTDTWTISYHPSEGGDPTSSAQTVYWAARPTAYVGSTGRVDGGVCEGLHIAHPLSNAGCIQMGPGGVVDRCLLVDGGKHHLVIASGTIRDTVMTKAVPDDVRGILAKSIVAFFADSDHVQEAQDYRVEGVVFTNTPAQAYVGHSVPAGSTLTIRGHVINEVDTGGALPDIPVTWTGGYVNRCRWPTGVDTLRYAMYDGREVTGNFQAWLNDATIEQSVLHGMISRRPNSATFTLRNCIVWGFLGNAPMGFGNLSGNAMTYDFENCLLLGNGALRDDGRDTIRLRRCLLYDPFNEVPTGESLSQLQTDHDVDGSNAYLTSDQLEALFFGDLRSPLKGDHRIDESANVTAADGTVYSGQLPDGTPLSEVGVTKTWDWSDNRAVPGRPTQWPTPPQDEADGTAYISAPDSWNWEGTPHENIRRTTNILTHAYEMSGSAGGGETDQIGTNDFSVTSGSPGSATIAGTSARTFDGNDVMKASPITPAPSDVWGGMLLRIDTRPSESSAQYDWKLFSDAAPNNGHEVRADLSTDEIYYRIKQNRKDNEVSLRVPSSSYSVGIPFVLQFWTNKTLGEYGLRVDDTSAIQSAAINGAAQIGLNQSSNARLMQNGAVATLGRFVFAVNTETSQEDRDWVYNDGNFRTIFEIQNRIFPELLLA